MKYIHYKKTLPGYGAGVTAGSAGQLTQVNLTTHFYLTQLTSLTHFTSTAHITFVASLTKINFTSVVIADRAPVGGFFPAGCGFFTGSQLIFRAQDRTGFTGVG